MRTKRSRLLTAFLGTAAFIAAGAVGAQASSLMLPEGGPARTAPSYATNAQGETYGSALDARTPQEEPDLIEAYGDDGTLGYVKADDLNGPDQTREEVLEHIEAQEEGAIPDVRIPLYERDGETVIGTFTIEGSDASRSQESVSGD
ncbi:hypothetical protein O4J56_23170 [Nocardiopsis sp. RSe5-2]|uniref:Uncharacterized protein n=1 Tax=Nocardiopsis endophytica TaxID=3018445 RepID=A0ABT4UB64_9ACTN|nr:hypothetical protein [Nocardiopsis endophytica]MDA2813567.1 hypothetical protein [Nocardiopsis endophytica]